MRQLILLTFVMQLLCLSIREANANSVIGLVTEAGKVESAGFISQVEKLGHQVTLLQDDTGHFSENSNTFVRLYNPLVNNINLKIINKEVYVAIPSSVNYDTLMEILVKIRAARTFGASEVIVASLRPLNEISLTGELSEELNLDKLIATAGADRILEHNLMREPQEVRTHRNAVTQMDYWIGGTNHIELRDQVAQILGHAPMDFNDLISKGEGLKGRRIYWIASPIIPANDSVFKTLAQIRKLERMGASVILVSPYLPYARLDKPEYDVGVAAEGRLIADLIEAVGTEGITVVRAHAPQSLGFFKIRSEEISGTRTIIEELKKLDIDCIISPDAGFQKDATKYQQALAKSYLESRSYKDVCLVVMNKQRDFYGRDKIVGGTGLEQLQGKRVVIIDDETASGGTLSHVADYIKGNSQPKEIFAVVTHLAGSAPRSLSSEAIESLIVTNTFPIFFSHQKLKILSIAPEIAQSIHTAESNR